MKIAHHYKSLLSAIISVALFYSAAPHADILDGGEIQFNGFVTDEAPKWTWQISSPDQTWAVDTADARTDNGQLVFNLRDKGLCRFWRGICMKWLSEVVPDSHPLLPSAVTDSLLL